MLPWSERPVRIVVCVKEIPDPEVASSVFQVDEDRKQIALGPALRLVISPFDAQAIEVALRLRDAAGEIAITLLCLGEESARAILKYGLSLGADEAFLLVDPLFEGGDSYATARTLAAAIRKIGGADLVLTGRQAADRDAGIVGPGIAELLGLPVVTFAMRVELAEGKLVVERSLSGGAEIVEARLPAVVTVSHEVGNVRHASLRETMKAARKPVTIWTAADLGLRAEDTGALGSRVCVERLYVPESDVECEYLEGNTAKELASKLVDRLSAARLI
jgi:electron transfer flavoprotein beta subunit